METLPERYRPVHMNDDDISFGLIETMERNSVGGDL